MTSTQFFDTQLYLRAHRYTSYIYMYICTHVYIYIYRYCGALSFMKHHRTTNPSMSSFLSSHQWWHLSVTLHYLRLERLCLQTITCHNPLTPQVDSLIDLLGHGKKISAQIFGATMIGGRIMWPTPYPIADLSRKGFQLVSSGNVHKPELAQEPPFIWRGF